MKQDITFDVARGVRGCVVDSWRVFALNWRSYLKNSWVYLLFTGLTGAFLVELLVQYAGQHLLPAYRLFQMEGYTDLVRFLACPDWSEVAYMMLSLLVFLFASYACVGRSLRMMRYYSENNSLPERMGVSLGVDERKMGKRLFFMDLFFLVGALLVAFPVTFLAYKYSWWILTALALWILYMWQTSRVARIRYAFQNETFKRSLAFGFKKSLGYSMVVQIVTFVPSVFLYIPFCLSVTICLFSELAKSTTILMGDVPGFPGYLPFLYFVLNAISLFMWALINSVRSWALTMKVAQ